ncbi:hypothetical protein DFJ73DRAFT_769871 [Zopfochytrium polystomum]|nr:hypothetical protein DFJ73DRAFT_769871 [Zopfochytrium polystomum]
MSTTQPPTQIPFASRNTNTSRPTAQFPPASGKPNQRTRGRLAFILIVETRTNLKQDLPQDVLLQQEQRQYGRRLARTHLVHAIRWDGSGLELVLQASPPVPSPQSHCGLLKFVNRWIVAGFALPTHDLLVCVAAVMMFSTSSTEGTPVCLPSDVLCHLRRFVARYLCKVNPFPQVGVRVRERSKSVLVASGLWIGIYAYRCQVFHNMFANCDFWHVVNFLLTDYDSMDSDEQADLLQRCESQFLPGAPAPDGPDGSGNAAGKSDSSNCEGVGEGDSDGDSQGTANDSMAAQAP